VELKREAARKVAEEKKLLEEKWDKVTVNFQKQIEDLRKLLVKERTEKEDLFEKLSKEVISTLL
jgi:DNA polymerase III delta prime subunit